MTIIELQEALKLCNHNPGLIDGIYGIETRQAVIRAQIEYGITEDGIAGIETKSKLSVQISQIQTQLNLKGYSCPIDGIVSIATKDAVMMIQKDYDLYVDGIVGMNTKSILFDEIDIFEKFDCNEQVTEHFNMNEFVCECAGQYCDGFPVSMNRRLIEKLEQVRDYLGVPLKISSGIRCEIWNEIIGGVPDSYHKLGRAVDVPVYEINGYSVDKIADIGEGFGLKTIRYYEESFVHFQYND